VETARAFLDRLPAELTPLAEAARSLLGYPGVLSADGALCLGHRPWVAPQNYALTLYPGLSANALLWYVDRFGLTLPEMYASFLQAVNGAFCYGMSLAGVPESMLGTPPLLERRRLQCHDLGMTTTSGPSEYRSLPAGAFHFGYRHYSYRENVGYFIVGERIMSIRKSGEVVGEWDGFSDFLRDEVSASAALDAELHPLRSTC